MKTTQILSEDAQCERCGRCLRLCPSYQNQGIETFSPRGRLYLIRAVKNGEISPGLRYMASMESCLQCMACTYSCPKGVKAAALIRQEKTQLIKRTPSLRTAVERIFLTMVLSNRHAIYGVTALLSRVQRLFVTEHSSQVRHLPMFLPEILAGRTVPLLSRRPFFAQFPEKSAPPPGIRERGSVILYTGCFFGYADTGPVRAALVLLRQNGYHVRIPKNQTCCGAPSLLGGYPEIARKSAEKNLEALDGNEPVITLCATCGNCLKNDYHALFSCNLADMGSRPASCSSTLEKALTLSERVVDINKFLADQPKLTLGITPVKEKVTIHDPCHLNRGLGVSEEMRYLLKRVPELEIHEMANSDACCGGGGLCALKNPGLSCTLGTTKAESILDTRADIAATPCPGCLLQISNSLSPKGSHIKTIHPVELMAGTFEHCQRND